MKDLLALCVILSLAMALMVYYHHKHKAEIDHMNAQRPSGLLAMMPMQKWDTIQRMIQWQGELSQIDAILETIHKTDEGHTFKTSTQSSSHHPDSTDPCNS